MDAKYKISGDLYFREERDGIYTIVANSMFFVIVDSSGLELIQRLIKLKEFNLQEVASVFGLNYEFSKKFFSELYNKGFLAKSERR
ncbi:MAG: hypothetical protein AB1465_05950 [Patescibacteria group bacterium]